MAIEVGEGAEAGAEFAKAERATIRALLAAGRVGIAREILPAAGQIFTVDPGEGGILAFSGRGAFRALVPFEPEKKPRRYLAAGALQRGKLLLVGQIGIEHGLLRGGTHPGGRES